MRRNKTLAVILIVGVAATSMFVYSFGDRQSVPDVELRDLLEPKSSLVEPSLMDSGNRDVSWRAIASSKDSPLEAPSSGLGELAFFMGVPYSAREREYHLKVLDDRYNQYMLASAPGSTANDQVAANCELLLTVKCVELIMNADGRASRTRDTPNGFRLGGKPGYRNFLANTAKYEFREGEFPVYDLAADRMDIAITGGVLEAQLQGDAVALDSFYRDASALLLK